MLVSPREQPTIEGLSYNGETAESGEKSDVVDAVGHIDSFALPEENGAMGVEEEEVGASDCEGDEGKSSDEDGGEARTSKGKKSPMDPTARQRDEHERTHMPYRSWCEDCVRARARNAPQHKRAAEDPLEEIKVPRCIWTISSCPGKTRRLAAFRCWSCCVKSQDLATPDWLVGKA